MRTVRSLTNGRYAAIISDAGAGYSALEDVWLTRWSADVTRDADGWFLYVRDRDTGGYWSAGHQPVQRPADRYEVQRGCDGVAIVREDDGVETRTEVRIAAHADIEWRRYTITNLGTRLRRLDLTTYVEVALNTLAADTGHPAFSKLFVQTEFLANSHALLARRRQRDPEEKPLFVAHGLVARTTAPSQVEFETDRARFIGRGRTLAAPLAMLDNAPLSGTVGSVLDPVLSLRRSFDLAPGESTQFDAFLAAGIDRSLLERTVAAATAPRTADAIFATDLAGRVSVPRFGALPEEGARRFRRAPAVAETCDGREPLQFFNGYGGFNVDANEYVIRLDRTRDGMRRPPVPWTNVVANETTGFVASESHPGYTWSLNSRLHRLTPWSNDPVCDPVGEAIYIRDEDAGIYWSPTPGPVPGSGAYETRHGFGYTTYRHRSDDLTQDLTCFVPRDAAAKVFHLRLTNSGGAPRRLSLFFYLEWVLGDLRSNTAAGISTDLASRGRVLLARNLADEDFGDVVAFAAVNGPGDDRTGFTTDRAAFLGYHGSTERPEAVAVAGSLDGRTGRGFDPCAAFLLRTSLASGQTSEWTFVLGQAPSRKDARRLAERFRDPEAVTAALHEVRDFWRDTLSGVQIETPSPALDVIVNGWLNYQNLSCRLWARSGFYQSGGALGFRDQLQDSAALVYVNPQLTRQQILAHAANQFVEGDVLHWWHPIVNRGLRTRFSDDLAWLPYVALFYVNTTGDHAVFDERVEFVASRHLSLGEDEALVDPVAAGTNASVYDHCVIAIDRALTEGSHGLPLIGTGDWNDGFNRVGRLGRGESAWLGFFLYSILEDMIPVCERRGDAARVLRYRDRRIALGSALNAAGWDGEWYRRAWYDDGAPLGSRDSDECQIDALAQAWAVLSGAAPPDRADQALGAMERLLVDEPAGLIRLLTPPFDRTPHDPGYIKGYLPGIRENGGQYTHAALWAVRALAEAGHSDRAAHLLDLLNPVLHGDTAEHIARYKVEPYVVAADVYGVAPHIGRGGWTWYTGSAGWMFRVALESVLGMTLVDGKTLVLRPCIPASWPGYTLRYCLPDRKTRYDITVRRVDGPTSVRAAGLDVRVGDGAVHLPLIRDGHEHRIEIALGGDLAPRYRPRLAP
jgi:N,N'-diacetylchitobiose phosphorylase